MARRPISLSLRFSVYARDKHTCQYCGGKPPEVQLQLDHVYPVALGGENGIDNLLTACRDCNIGKGARDPGLAMANRPLTFWERHAYAQDRARWWAHCLFVDRSVKAILWEIAAKAAEDGSELELGSVGTDEFVERQRLLRGLDATGLVRIHSAGSLSVWLLIEHEHGREDNIDGSPWSLGSFSPPRFLPNVAEVH